MRVFQEFDFDQLNNPEFKEDSVREALLKPLLNELGYSASSADNRIIRSKTLTHPFVKSGANRRHEIRSVPDYLMEVDGQYAWVLDAKSPDQSIVGGDHREQVYFYAIHPDVRVVYYAISNGREFALYHVSEDEAVLHFRLAEIESFWEMLTATLAPSALSRKPHSNLEVPVGALADYSSITPFDKLPLPEKQSAKRHYGVHGYFTKQAWNIVQTYIERFSRPGDMVLDPFGGSGVTFVEALLMGRKAAHIDINPLSIFLVENLVSPVNLASIEEAYSHIRDTFARNKPETEEEVAKALSTYDYPKKVTLPENSDVETVEELFSRRQLAQLAYLKYLIQQVDDGRVRGILMLMFSGLLNQINLTYHASGTRSAGRGDSAMFRYYRYRLAPEPSMLEILPRLELRYRRVMAAKRELAPFITDAVLAKSAVYQGSATNLERIPSESVDYIYTDPPYGAKIPYLDLSTMWNAWLGLEVTSEDRNLEVIEGGDLHKSAEEYSDLMDLSIKEMYRVLKFGRWMSFVFAHKDPHFWHRIIDSAEAAGFEYAGAVKQASGKTTYKKRQNPFSVIEGQLIVSFKKVKDPKAIMRVELGADIAAIVEQTIEGIIVKNDGATLEQINDELILRGLELGFLDLLSKEYQDISPFLATNFDYDDRTKKFHIVHNTKIRSRIDIRLRIRYYLISYLRRMEKLGVFPTTDEIVWNIMPLLRNGNTPEDQTILTVLEEVATRHGDNRWRLNDSGLQRSFHLD